MSSNDNERIFRRYVEEAVNGGDMDVFEELVAQDFVDHDPNEALFTDEGPEGETLREKSRRHLLELRDAAPDLHYTLDNVTAAGERVSFNWVATGTHRGPYLGFPPTGKSLRMEGTGAARLVDGRIVETWDEWDAQEFVRQLSGH